MVPTRTRAGAARKNLRHLGTYQSDIVAVFASMDCADIVLYGFQSNEVNSFKGEDYIDNLAKLENFSSLLICQTELQALENRIHWGENQKWMIAFAAYAILKKQMLASYLVLMFLATVAYPGTFSIAQDASFAMRQLKLLSKTLNLFEIFQEEGFLFS